MADERGRGVYRVAERGLNTNDGDNLPHGQYLHLHVSHNIVPKCQKL